MTRRQLLPPFLLAASLAALCALALWLTSCQPTQPELRIYGAEQLDAETLRDVADHLDRAPANPWPCVTSISLGARCPGTHGCYYPDEGNIYSSPAALGHEILHAAGECWGDYDPQHLQPWWRDVDGVR